MDLPDLSDLALSDIVQVCRSYRYFSFLENSIVQKNLWRDTINPLSAVLVAKCASHTDEPGGQTWECQAVVITPLILQQHA